MSKDTVQDGLVVSMDYKLTVDGEVLDSSEDAGPLQFLAGYGNIVPGLEREMAGMKIGESKDVVVAPADGYGEFDEEAFILNSISATNFGLSLMKKPSWKCPAMSFRATCSLKRGSN